MALRSPLPAATRCHRSTPLRRGVVTALAWAITCWLSAFVLTQCVSVRAVLFSPQDVPGPPEKVLISSASDSSVRVQFIPPARIKAEGNNGAPVLGYKVEVAKRVHDVQTFTVEANGPVVAGAYKMKFKIGTITQVTTCIAWNATAIEFETVLEELPIVDSVHVTRSALGTNAAANGYVYTITFDGKYLVSGAQPNVLVGDQQGCQVTLPRNRVLTLRGAHVTRGVAGYSPEVWEVVTSDSAGTNVLGGSFDLSLGFEGAWRDTTITATIAPGSRTVTTSAAMVGLVNRGDQIRIGDDVFTVHRSAAFTDTELPLDSYHIRGTSGAIIYLKDTVLGDVAVTTNSHIVTTATDLSALIGVGEHIQIGGLEFKVAAMTAATASARATLSIQEISQNTGDNTWLGPSKMHITAYRRKKVTVAATADAAAMKRALDGLPGIGAVDISRLGPTAVNGYRWRITFLSLGSKSSCPLSPCLHADKMTGATTRLTDVFGDPCPTCDVAATQSQDEARTLALTGITGQYESASVVATKEVGGVIDEVQSIATEAADDDIRGSFAVNFRNSFVDSPGATIHFDDTEIDVQVKLENLPTIGRLNVTRSDNDEFGITWLITFLTNTGDLPLVIVDTALLTGTSAAVVVQEVVKGVDVAFETFVDGLQPSEDYFVRASARNLNGYGAATDILQRDGKGALPLYASAGTVADAPVILNLLPVSDSELEVSFRDPVHHGAPVETFVLEYAAGETFGKPAIKALRIASALPNDIAGTFQLQYGDAVSPLLGVHTSASDMVAALRTLRSLRPVEIARAVVVFAGDATSSVQRFIAASNILTTTPLRKLQSQLLVSGCVLQVDVHTFTVKTQPAVGSTTIEVLPPGAGAVAFTGQTFAALKVDATGAEFGPFGYEWAITFTNEIGAIVHNAYPGLQLLSTALSSVEKGTALTTATLRDKQLAVPPAHTGSFEISNDGDVCDTYVVGAPSPVQVLQLFASTTITEGKYQLQLGAETTPTCISLTKASLKAALEAFDHVSKVAIDEQRLFKVSVLTGSTTSKVTMLNAAKTLLSVTSTGPGLTTEEAAVLTQGAIIQVSRNPNDFSRHACELQVTASAAVGATAVSVTPVNPTTCTSFSNEARVLQVLDFVDYKIRFWGRYPTGEWPTLSIVQETFGDGVTCQAWKPIVPVYATIHTIKYEGVCARGSGGTQTILADAASDISGWFSLSYLGVETSSLAFQTTSASAMRAAIDSITAPGTVNVSLSQYGAYGKAWHITFATQHVEVDTLFIKHSYLTGQDASISVYPTVKVFTDATQKDLSGSFRLSFGGAVSERIGHTATHMKVVQELQKLSTIDAVVALGDVSAGDMGVYPLALTVSATYNDALLTGIRLKNGHAIDPTLYVAIGEKLTIGVDKYTVDAVTPVDITLKPAYTGGTGSVTVLAGMITKRTKPLPGFVSIDRLMRIVTATQGTKTLELPTGHGYAAGNTLYIAGQPLTVASVGGATNTIVMTNEFYDGPDVVAASPELFVFDNMLRTTEDLRNLVTVTDDLWLRSSPTSDLVKYTVTQVDERFVRVDGVFTTAIVRGRALHTTHGRKWSLVFRSFAGDLESIDAIPANDWRGTGARIGVREPRIVRPLTVRAGNPAVVQTVLLEANAPTDVDSNTKYTLTFGDETTAQLPWNAPIEAIKQNLEDLDGIDGVTVASTVYENGFVHTITFWGIYATPTLPVLTGAVIGVAGTLGSVDIRVQSNNAVAHSKQETVVLQTDANCIFRLFAVNAKGISDSRPSTSTRARTVSVVPSIPTSVTLGEYHGETWLSVHYRPPFYAGGAPITMYRLEWDSSPSFDSLSADYGVANIQKRFEVQLVTTTFRSDTNIGGTFTLAWGGRTTTPLRIDCTELQMADALAVITDTMNVAIEPVKVTRTAASSGYTWLITFLHTPGDLALLVADGSLIAGDFPRIAVTEVVAGRSDLAIGDFTREVQDVYTDAASLLSGTFKLSFEGKLTGAIDVDASALEMQKALQDTTAIYSIKVTKTWRNPQLNTAIWSVTFAYLRGDELVGAGNIFTIAVAQTTGLSGTAATVRVANKVAGSDPFAYTITNLRPGVRYYFHAMAYNADGFGSANSPLSSAVTCGHPAPPGTVVATVVNGKTLAVTWSQRDKSDSIDNSGNRCPIDKYRVEWYRAEGNREEQTVTTSAGKGLPEIQRIVSFADSPSLGGYFKLSFLGERTENIRYDAPALGLNSVKERLERLATVGTVDVTRDDSIRVVSGLFVKAVGTTLTVDAASTTTLTLSGLAAQDFIWVAGTKVRITNIPTTTSLTIDATLTTDVAVPVFRTAFGYQWRVTFLAGHVGAQELLQVFPSDSWAGKNPGLTIESLQQGLQPISGTFRLSFASRGLSQTTLPLPHNVSALDMKRALENLVTVGAVDVARSPNGFGFNWIVTFLTDVKSDIALLGADGTELHGPSVRIMTAMTNVGVQPTMYCEKNGAPGVPVEIASQAALRYDITGLTTGQRYTVRVRAHNEHGYGSAAYIAPSFQVPRTVPTAPIDVQLIVQSGKMLKVRWDAPVSDGGAPISSYKIEWDISSGFANVGSPSYDMIAELRVQATDVGPFYYNIAVTVARAYYVRVLAVNDQGKGAPQVADPASATPVDRTPGRAENARATVLSSSAILVEWELSSSTKPYFGGNGGLPITQYMVEWDSSAAFDSPAAFGLVRGTTFSYIIGGDDAVTGVRSSVLIPGTLYFIRVTAFNAMGAGSPRATTPPSVLAANQAPTSPRNLQLSVIPSTSIQASWVNPLYDGGASLKSYQVEWDEQDDFSSGQSASATIPIVREVQSIVLSTNVVNEEQFVDATVGVINEQQVVRTLFTGADEIQTITTTNDVVVDEIQTITTSATDRDEVQEIRIDATDVNEIQAIRTIIDEVPEVQRIQIGATRLHEEQTVTIAIQNAVANRAAINGEFYLTFDTRTGCTHCTKTRGIMRTGNLLAALQDVSETGGADTVQTELNALTNIDAGATMPRTGVAVTRLTTFDLNGNDLTYVFTITFTGVAVAGNVPELIIDNAVTVGGTSVSNIRTYASELKVGNEVLFDPASVFTIKFTCEAYADIKSIGGYPEWCKPPDGDKLCAACVTDFNGLEFTVTTDFATSNTIVQRDRLIAGACVFEVDVVTPTTLTILSTDIGRLCSTYAALTVPLDLFRAQKQDITIPVKSEPSVITVGSVVEGQLKLIIDSVSVTQTQVIDAGFVGTLYDVTFRGRSGSLPMLECVKDAIRVTRTVGGNKLCDVTRPVIGSMITGAFKVALVPEDGGAAVSTNAIPWDATEIVMKNALEKVEAVSGEKVFGTVKVVRTPFFPTANKWSGGFTWQIEFLSRGWNIPTMTADNALLTNSDSTKNKPTILIEDGTHPLPQLAAGSRDGNEITGSMVLSFGGVDSIPCELGTHTSKSQPHERIEDLTLRDFIVSQLGTKIPSIEVWRSPSTQAKGFTWTLKYSDSANGGDIPKMGLSTADLRGTGVFGIVSDPTPGNQLGGKFQLQFNGETTGPILFSAGKETVEAQLNSLNSIKPSFVTVDRIGPLIDVTPKTQVLGYTWFITFRSSVWVDPTSDHANRGVGNWKGTRAKWDDVWPGTLYSKAWGRHVGPMWNNNFRLECISLLTTTASDGSQKCTPNVLTHGIGPIKGTFTLQLDTSNVASMAVRRLVDSMPIAHNAFATKVESGATETSVEEILEKMINVGDVAVSRSLVDENTGGYTWTITFLRDANNVNGKCTQEEVTSTGVRLCNSPGNVPALTAITAGTLTGSNARIDVCDKASCPMNTVVQDGRILRGDFTTFRVTGDPGFEERYQLTLACAGVALPTCAASVERFAIVAGSEDIVTHLVVGDRFTVGTYTTCVFRVKALIGTPVTQVQVDALACPGMASIVSVSDPLDVFLRVPWNADAALVQRVLEASSNQDDEEPGSIWERGRKVAVTRTIHGKYGEVSWLIQFISNPTFTPPGAGDIPKIEWAFEPSPAVTFDVSVTQVTQGSVGLSGSFLVDFHSTIGLRSIRFDEDEARFQRKLNEMNTIGRVVVKKIKYPSRDTGCYDASCAGGWDDVPVAVPGTRGGYRWRIRFLTVTGEFGGLTFPSGSGNVGPLTVERSLLQGNQRSIDVKTNMAGSSPILGGFTLGASTKATPLLSYASTAESIKQGIESMALFGDVDVTREFLVTQEIPTAGATLSKDGRSATIAGVSDIRLFLAPGDIVRFGPPPSSSSSSSSLAGTNGDSPFTSVLETSKVTMSALSPIVRAAVPAATKLLYPHMQLRIDGLVYDVQRSGREIQTVTVTRLAASWDPDEHAAFYKLTLSRGGASQTTTCIPLQASDVFVADLLNAKLQLLFPTTAQAGDIQVTRVGPIPTDSATRIGYVYSIYFVGDSIGGDVAMLQASTTGCASISDTQVIVKTVAHGGAIGHQRISLATDAGQVIDTQGYFLLKRGTTFTTPCLSWGVDAKVMEQKIEQYLQTGDVVVARRGSGNSVTEIQRLRLTSNSEVTSPATGLFQLQFTLDGRTSATTCLAYGISAEDMENKLNELTNMPGGPTHHVLVTRDGDGTSAWGYGYEYVIHFRGPIAGDYSPVLGDMQQLEIIKVGQAPCAPVVGGNPALIVETVRQGAAGFDYDIYFLDSPDAVTTLLVLQDAQAGGACNVNPKWRHTGGTSRKVSITMVALGGSSEVQTLVVRDPTTPIPSTAQYKLTFGGETTACLASDISAPDLRIELEKLVTSIGTGGVLVSRDSDAVVAPNGGYVYQITFIGDLATGNVANLQPVTVGACPTNLAPTASATVTEATPGGQVTSDFALTQLYAGERPGVHVAYSVAQLFRVLNERIEVQTVTVLNPGQNLASETYKLTVPTIGTTPAIAWDADDAAMEAAFASIIPSVDVVVTRRVDDAAAPRGFVYTIYFTGDSVQGDIADMTVTQVVPFTGGNDVVIGDVVDGVAGGVAPFTARSIPLAQLGSSTTPALFLPNTAALSVYKANGFFWTVKFKSTVGNVPALTTQTAALTGTLAVVDDFVPGAASSSYVIANLLAGINYFVRVAAGTDVGLGPFTELAAAIPSGPATPVLNVAAGYALHTREVQEVRLAATHITEVQTITTSAVTIAEVQTLRTFASSDVCSDGNCIGGAFAFRVPTIQTIRVSATAPISAGSYAIGLTLMVSNSLGAFTPAGGTVTTGAIAWDAEAITVQTELEGLSGIAQGDIVVTRDGDKTSASFGYGFVYSVTFVGNNVAGQVPPMTIVEAPTCTSCTAFVVLGGRAHPPTVDVNPTLAMGTDTTVQQVVVRAALPLFAGSYKLKLTHLGAEQTSDCILFNAPARGASDIRAMETILQRLPNIDKVYVTRHVDATLALNGFVYQLFFYGNGVRNDVQKLEYDYAGCTPFQTQVNNVLTTTDVNSVIDISVLDHGGFSALNTFVDAKTATADQLTRDLNRLPVFGDVLVSQSLADKQGGFVWTIAFKHSQGDLPQFICAVDSQFTAKPTAGCETTTLTDGNVLSGSFVVESSVPIAFNADAVAMKTALEAMSWVGAVQVMRTGPSAQMGYTWTLTFLDYFGDVPTLLVTSSLVGTSAAIDVREVRKGNVIGGTFTLSYMGTATAPIKWNAKATASETLADGSSLQEKLEALDSVGPLTVERSTMDREGGMAWRITFLDNLLNPGDVPLLQANGAALTGVGVIAFVREVRKGSSAVGDQLWLSFDPPASDSGSPIIKYQVRWDTLESFTASPGEYFIADPETLYRTQHIVTGAQSIAWSSVKPPQVDEVQSITITQAAQTSDTFTLSFRGQTTAPFVIGTSTVSDVATALAGLTTIETIVVTPATATTLSVATPVILVTFTSELGDLPSIVSDTVGVATVAEVQQGATRFRKEVIVFSCLGGAGKSVTFGIVGSTEPPVVVASTASPAVLRTSLHTLFKVEADSISVSPTQSTICALANPLDITIVFHRVYGDISLAITSTDATVTRNAAASIDGVYKDVSAAKMSGTFQVGYNGAYTRSLNAESSAADVRYALEDLPDIHTAAVTRDLSFQPIAGKLDVVQGQIYVTCSTGKVCDFRGAAYGLPGYKLRIGRAWYTVRTDTASGALDATRLYLGDANGRETSYLGDSETDVIAYEWLRGYVWSVQLLSVTAPLATLRPKIPRLYPRDASVVVRGASCDKCYYLPTQTTKRLTVGQTYFIQVVAINAYGNGFVPAGSSGSVRATPSQVPNAPSNVDLVVVSGKEIEVFFSPPTLITSSSTASVHPSVNNDITSYIVQWDDKPDFKHGLPLCAACATTLQGDVFTVTSSLTTLLRDGSKFTIADDQCVLTVAATALPVTATRIDVVTGHGCTNFNARAYPLSYYTYEPAVLTGQLIQGSPPFRFLISNLVVAKKYYVRVAAVNSVPVQQIALNGNPRDNRKWSFALAATTKDTVPDPPVSVYLYPFSGTTLELQIQPPTRDGYGTGEAAITSYWVDVDTVSTFDSPTKAAPVDVAVAGGDIPLLFTGGPRIYYIKDLTTGTRYFVQVKAKNAIGASRATLAPSPLAPTRSPDGPVNVKVSTVTTSTVAPIDAVTVTWQRPVSNGGLPLTSYKVEWWGEDARHEVQVIEIAWTVMSPTALFTLAFGGSKTGSLPLDVTAENLRNALMNIVVGGVQQIRHIDVSQSTINAVRGYQWRVTFLSPFNAGDVPLIQLAITPHVDGQDTKGRVYEVIPGARVPPLGFPGFREVQVLMTTHATMLVSGYFRLSYKGSAWSNYLPADVSAATLKLTLEALPTVGKVTVNFVGGPQPPNALLWTITFDSNVGNAPVLAVDSTKITPSDAFVGVKDGDNTVDNIGKRCVPGEIDCPGNSAPWPFTTGVAAMAAIGEVVSDYGFYETIDASTLTYKITGLVAGKLYYVSVTAKNALGLGVRIRSTPVAITPPVQVPGRPTSVSLGVKAGSATQITATWSAPTSNGGADVRMYRVDYDPSPLFTNRGQQDFWCPTAPTYAVWKVTTARTPGLGDPINAGAFALRLTRANRPLTTDAIPWNAVALAEEEVGSLSQSTVFCTACTLCTEQCGPARRAASGSLQSKLSYLSSISSVDVVRSPTASADGGFTWTITFNDVGDDFLLESEASMNMLACSIGSPNTCTQGTYTVTATKLTAGIANSACTGTQTLPAIGALNKGQLYNVRVFAYNKVGFGAPALAGSPQKPMVVPGPPTGVTLQVVSATDLKVLFSPPDDDGGDTIVAYQIEWSFDQGFTNPQTGIVANLAGGAPYYRPIGSLLKGEFYYVRVKAANSQGYGQYQRSSPERLNPHTTPSAPAQVTLGITSSTMLTVQWNVPDDTGGATITAYVVQWDISASFDSLGADASKVKISDTTQRAYTMTLLSPETVYYVRVFAMNAAGIGTPQTSTPVSLIPANTRPGKPHTLTAEPTATTGELMVKWELPRIPAHLIPCGGTQLVPQSCPIVASFDVVFGGTKFESYFVQWAGNSDFTGFNKVDSKSNFALLTGLDSGKLYYVRVLTVNSAGLMSDFCARANAGGYLCPDNLVLLDGNVVTGSFVSARPK